MEEKNFLDELLEEAERSEEKQTESYYDLVLLQVRTIKGEIEKNFSEAEKECEIIRNWALERNSKLSDKIKFLELKLEAFIKERDEKTIDLPNGVLKLHKKPDKIEVEDIELFLKNAKPEMLTVVPEQVKPDLNKIKSYMKTKPTPKGVKVIEGKEEFTYKLKGQKNNGREKEDRTTVEQENTFRTAV